MGGKNRMELVGFDGFGFGCLSLHWIVASTCDLGKGVDQSRLVVV